MPKTVDKRSFLFNSPFIHGSMMFRREVLIKSVTERSAKTANTKITIYL